MYTRTILCLANSKKLGGTCVAGKRLTGQTLGEWIRPVSGRKTREISDVDRLYEDRTYADVFDIVEIDFRRSLKHRHQTENHLIAASEFWRNKGKATWKQVQRAVDDVPGELWVNGHSTRGGLNDKVPDERLDEIADSLKLVKVRDLRLHVAYEAGWQGKPGKRKVRGSFTLRDQQYRLAVTDISYENEYRARPYGRYAVGSAILCVSLAEPVYGYAFKLIATIITRNRLETG